MAVLLRLPPNWQAVSVDVDGAADLAAFRLPEGDAEYTPNLTLTTRPGSAPLRTLADRALGRQAGEPISVFRDRAWDSGLLRGFHLREHGLTRFLLHTGLPGGEVAEIVLTCADHQRDLVEAEFEAILSSLAVETPEGER